ncbi:hypothetical protein QNI19_33025 [Cytophagaceae bacterium DM2B3-1]|uniref:Uncharacterized protein n=1 Tax=Xanthocytophaga flava TaxID=3048013 RepID=A0ABT7CWB9_9BACT|nr:hypothetical protein [Xanthocytophaga flavus]MDJ1497811.1 hypothetical protein [Xanthocytophaga flavus]
MPQESVRREHYVGILLAYVEAINPTDAERIEMGIVTQESLDSGRTKPVNYREEDGRYRIDFWLKGKDESGRDVRVRHSLFVKNEDARPSTVGNIQVINQQGKTAYIPQVFFEKGKSPYEDWFSAPFQRARVGEAELLHFVNAWMNKKTEDKAVVLDFASISKGNLKQLHQILQSDKASYVKIMLGVRIADDGRRFQTVFPRLVMPSWTINYERLHKELVNYLSNAQSRNDYGVTPDMAYDRKLYRLRVYDEVVTTSNSSNMMHSNMQEPISQLDLPITSMHDEDLPF